MFYQSPKNTLILLSASVTFAVAADLLGMGRAVGRSFAIGTTLLVVYFIAVSFLVRILFFNAAAPKWFAALFAVIAYVGWFGVCEVMGGGGRPSLILIFAAFSAYRMLRMNEPKAKNTA